MSEVAYPPRCEPGDRVAVVSPSSALPAVYPHVHDLGLRRLREDFGLVPVEYPTTRRPSSPRDRAADLMAAIEDPSIKAVMASIGGEDQITVLPHLDFAAIARNPKPFFGYSDNTNLLNALMLSGVVGYHGGSTMVHLGRSVEMHPMTASSLKAALFEGGRFELTPADAFSNHPLPWINVDNLDRPVPMRRATPWVWQGPRTQIAARLWGGNLEILNWTMQVGRWIAEPNYYKGTVLFIETSEEMPPPAYVFRTLRHLGERGILEQLAGLIVGRPMSEEFGHTADPDEVERLERAQYEAVRRAMDRYNPTAVVVLGLDSGHTDPQLILPIGGLVEMDSERHRIHVVY